MAAPYRRRARRGATVVATALAVLATCLSVNAAPVPATAAAVEAEPGASPPPARADVPPGEYQVTLITGDRVALTVDATGRIETAVEHWATWPGRSAERRVNGSSGPDGVFVIPEDVQPAVDAGWLDRSLFDVGYLAAHGLHDARTSTLPVVLEYSGQALRLGSAQAQDAALLATAEAAPASTATAALSSVGGAALAVSKAQAATFWQSLGRSRTTRSADTVEKVWLDRPVSVALNESVPLIGAPSAWAAGFDGAGTTVAVLDTGIDENHPDLRGSVVVARSFVGGEVRDGHGHGTHVAATVAGRGQRKGVAPAANLAIGKVLSDTGSGSMSGIIDGMEWATQEAGADVVSMSLGGDPTDGTDPASQAVNALTASTGALFVIAAGNSGPAERTVAAPAAADAALTVAATDKQDGLAKFSSRGPRIDGALKPDISAPGVAIVAARAAGTSLGTPVDDLYTSLNGTSMATPHVAGAAAIVRQRHPDWTPERIKAALMSTSTDAGGPNAYHRGAGRVDVARAVSQQVVATTASVDFGGIEATHTEPVTRQVEFSNSGTEPVTLSLTATLRTGTGSPVGAGVLTTDPELTVPAGGTATATVTLNVEGLPRASYSGTVEAVAAGSGVRVRVPVGVIVELPGATLTIRTLDRAGEPLGDLPVELGGSVHGYAPWPSLVTAMNVPGASTVTDRTTAGPGVERFRVKHGSYNVRHNIMWWDDSLEKYVIGALFDAQVDVTGDTEVVLDARKAQPITWSLPREGTAPPESIITLDLGTADRGILNSWGTGHYLTPTEAVTANTFRVGVKLEQYRNTQLTMTVQQPRRVAVPLQARCYADRGLAMCPSSASGEPNTAGGWVPFPAGRRTLQLVDAGFGDPQDIAGLDLRGKLALVRWGDDRVYPGVPGSAIWTDRIDNLQRAGAVGFVGYADPQGEKYARHSSFNTPTSFFFHWPQAGPKEIRIPELQVLRAVGGQLRELTRNGPATVEVNSDPNIRYAYHAHVFYRQQVPENLHHELTDRDFTRVDGRLHDETATKRAYMTQSSWLPGSVFNSSFQNFVATPRTGFTEYYGPLEDDVVWTRRLRASDSSFSVTAEPRAFNRPDRIDEDWNVGPHTPGPNTMRTIPNGAPGDIPLSGFVGCTMCREGDSLVPLRGQVNGEGQGGGSLSTAVRVFAADGTEVPLTRRSGVPVFQLPAGPGRYTATLAERNYDTTWSFQSERTVQQTIPQGTFCFGRLVGWGDPCAAQPLIYPVYDLSDVQKLDNTVPASPPVLRFGVRVATGQSTAAMPAVAGLRLWTSVDGGARWRPALVVPRAGYRGGERWFEVTSLHGGRPGQKLSLKSEAWDTAGNRVEQVVKDVVTLS